MTSRFFSLRRAFISFQYEDRHYADLMDAWAANENTDFDFYDERLKVAVNSQNAAYIRSQLSEKIRRASVLVCVIGATTYSSPWVSWEIAYAKSQDKGLVGIETILGFLPPPELSNAGAVFVPFKQAEITRAIEWAATSAERTQDWRYT